MQWEQFLDLLTVVEVMLFIFGRLLMSGSASAQGVRGPDMHSKCPAWKNLRDVPGLAVLTHSALLYNSSCGTQCLPLTLSQSVSFSLLYSLSCLLSLSILSIFFNLIFPSLPPHQPPSHPSPISHIHLWSSQHILGCYCFFFRFGRPVFTDGLRPVDQYFSL